MNMNIKNYVNEYVEKENIFLNKENIKSILNDNKFRKITYIDKCLKTRKHNCKYL